MAFSAVSIPPLAIADGGDTGAKAHAAAVAEPERPNIRLILTDDQDQSATELAITV